MLDIRHSKLKLVPVSIGWRFSHSAQLEFSCSFVLKQTNPKFKTQPIS